MNITEIMDGLERLGVVGTADGDEWFTRAEAEQATGLSACQTGIYLRKAVQDGVLEIGKVKRRQIDRVEKRVTAYRFVRGENEPAAPGRMGTLGSAVRRDRPTPAPAR